MELSCEDSPALPSRGGPGRMLHSPALHNRATTFPPDFPCSDLCPLCCYAPPLAGGKYRFSVHPNLHNILPFMEQTPRHVAFWASSAAGARGFGSTSGRSVLLCFHVLELKFFTMDPQICNITDYDQILYKEPEESGMKHPKAVLHTQTAL